MRGRSVHDYSLPRHCPRLLDNLDAEAAAGAPPPFTVPGVCARDLLQRLRDPTFSDDGGDIEDDDDGDDVAQAARSRAGAHALRARGLRHYWPSLFIGGAGTSSGLHVDHLDLPFVLVQLAGAKRWVVASRDAAPRLEPDARSPLRFNASLLGARNASVPAWEGVLRPGELIFVPAGCPHEVRNLDARDAADPAAGSDDRVAAEDWTLAVALNYVDAPSADRVAARARDARYSAAPELRVARPADETRPRASGDAARVAALHSREAARERRYYRWLEDELSALARVELPDAEGRCEAECGDAEAPLALQPVSYPTWKRADIFAHR